jgi:8-oxo-dGTP diphosphatase
MAIIDPNPFLSLPRVVPGAPQIAQLTESLFSEFSVPRVGVGLALFGDNDKAVLLGQRKAGHACGMWGFPGGHQEKWEDFEDTARRELREEAGALLSITRPQFWTAVNTRFPAENKHYVVVFMAAKYKSGAVGNCEPDKCDGWEWFDIDTLPQPLMPGIQYLVDCQVRLYPEWNHSSSLVLGAK